MQYLRRRILDFSYSILYLTTGMYSNDKNQGFVLSTKETLCLKGTMQLSSFMYSLGVIS